MMLPTPEQQAIIDHPMAPLRVAAGAGTGKTTTMALRLAALVGRGTVEPEEALGITFTNKAAGELADRLRRELPHLATEGREIEVATYHGFAHKLLDEFGALVGVERNARIITPGFARQLLLDALASTDCPTLDLTARGRRVDELARLSDQLGDNLLEAARLQTEEPADEVALRRIEMARVLERYDTAKRSLRTLDYSDLIRLAARLVDEHPAVSDRIRSRYRVVLLDEYQDTNPAQRLLLRGIFGDGFPVTAVGDPDQTIYEWRGASLANFAGFPEHFAGPDGLPAPTLPLLVNRRCDGSIIDLANGVRARIGDGSPAGDLVPLDTAGPGTVLAGWFRTAVEEAAWIAAEMTRLHDEGLAWSAMAALFRKNAQIPLIRDALRANDIPVEVVSLGGLLSVPEVTELHSWLRLVGRPDDAPSLVRVLVGSRFRLGLGDLAPLARWVAGRRRPGGRGPDQPGWAMLEAIDDLDHVDGLSAEARLRLAEFRLIYRGLLEEAQGVTLAELCRSVLDRVGAWPEVDAMDDAARLSARLNLYRFLDLAEDWSPLEGRTSLEAFLDYLEVLADEAAPEELDVARLSGDDAVALLTVHRAKGLEWEAVFLPALCKDTFPARSQGFDDPVTLPYAVPYRLRLDGGDPILESPDDKARREALRTRHDAQEWRTAYVAVTRARHRLTLTGAFWYGPAARPKAPSELLAIARDMAATRVVADTAEPGEAPALLQFDTLVGAPDPHFEGGWKTALREIMADPGWAARRAGPDPYAYDAAVDQLRLVVDGLPRPPPPEPEDTLLRLSVTGLVTYASCPKRYFWNEVERLPRRPAPALRRGIELHRRIELHNRGIVPLEEMEQDTYDLATAEGAGEPTPGAFTAFRESRFGTARPILVEAPFDLAVGAARVRGRIDAVYEDAPGSWEIVDFKSGRARPDPAMRVQMEAYALAVGDAGFTDPAPARLTATFVFLGNGVEEVGENVDEDWLTGARTHVEDLVAGIEAGAFDPAPSDACRNCDFLRFCPEGRAATGPH